MEHDPEGLRTIGVVTKCDTLPANGDFVAKLRMERPSDVHLPGHGFIAVSNSPAACGRHVTSQGTIQSEMTLFMTHPQLKELAPLTWGIPTLVSRLHEIQSAQLDTAMPSLAHDIAQRVDEAKKTLATLPPLAATEDEKRMRLLDIVHRSSLRLHELITATDTVLHKHLHLAARSSELCEEFAKRITADVPNFLSDEAYTMLEAQLGETKGVYLPNFMHGAVFKRIVKQAFEGPMKKAAEELVQQVSLLVKAALESLIGECALSYPRLAGQLTMLAHAAVDEEKEHAMKSVLEKVDAEMNCPYTVNAAYAQLIDSFELQLAAAVDKHTWGDLSSGSSNEKGSTIPHEFVMAAVEDHKANREGARLTRKLQVSLHAYQSVMLARQFDCIPMDVRYAITFPACLLSVAKKKITN